MKKHFSQITFGVAIAVALLGTATTHAALPNYSVYAEESAENSKSLSRLSSTQSLSRKSSITSATHRYDDMSNVQMNRELGAPSFAWASPELAKPALGPVPQQMRAEAAGQYYLKALSRRYGWGNNPPAGARISEVHDTGRGAVIVKIKQKINDIEVMGAGMSLILDSNHSLVAASGSLAEDANRLAKVSKAKKSRGNDRDDREFVLSDKAVFELAAKADFGIDVGDLDISETDDAAYTHFRVASGTNEKSEQLAGDARIKPVYFRSPDKLIPAYYMEMGVGKINSNDSELYGIIRDASTGKLLQRSLLTQNESYAYRVFADNTGTKRPWDGPQHRAGLPHPTGIKGSNYMPTFKAPNIVNAASGPISTNDPWLPPSATETTGNNVDAYADLAAPQDFSPGDYRADANGTDPVFGNTFFDYTLNPDIGANANQNQIKAAITQMFYTVNWLHDWFYDSGFNEAAGNAQMDNYGRGGIGGDSIKAQAQDYSGTNNANMDTPLDGEQPRMQMYVYFHPGDIAQVKINTPAGLGPYAADGANFGSQNYGSLSGDLVDTVDGVSPSTDACQPISNTAEMVGNIALIDRGTCNFTVKIKNAQNAGAIGAIVASDGRPVGIMGGTDATITIPSMMVSLEEGVELRAAMTGTTVNASLLLANPALPSRDSSVDNMVIAHEWGHYISNRLIGTGFGYGNWQGGSMGEGWGDFTAVLMTVEAQDTMIADNANWGGAYAMGGYADQGRFPNDAYYEGIRGWPYTTDMIRNPLVMKSLIDGTVQTFSPHGGGTVWATVLWELYASLLRNHSFATAQQRMKDYYVAGMKATPDFPTYLEARDAFLAVAKANDIADYNLWATAFAKRGFGVGAIAPPRFSSDNSGLVQSFATGGAAALSDLAITLTKDCDRDGVIDAGDGVTLTANLTNSGFTNLRDIDVTFTSDAFRFGDDDDDEKNNVVKVKRLDIFGSKSVSVRATLLPAKTASNVSVAAVATSRSFDPTVPVQVAVQANALVSYNLYQTETIDNASKPFITDWSSDSLSGTINTPPTLFDLGNGNFYWVSGQSSLSDAAFTSPTLVVGSADNLVINYSHAYQFEQDPINWDGGVVEYSADNGITWQDAGAYLSNAYTGIIDGTTLQGRHAYVGVSAGFPALVPATLDLSGLGLGGKNVKIRFRVASDEAGLSIGFLLDDFVVTGISNKPFSVIGADMACRFPDKD